MNLINSVNNVLFSTLLLLNQLNKHHQKSTSFTIYSKQCNFRLLCTNVPCSIFDFLAVDKDCSASIDHIHVTSFILGTNETGFITTSERSKNLWNKNLSALSLTASCHNMHITLPYAVDSTYIYDTERAC